MSSVYTVCGPSSLGRGSYRPLHIIRNHRPHTSFAHRRPSVARGPSVKSCDTVATAAQDESISSGGLQDLAGAGESARGDAKTGGTNDQRHWPVPLATTTTRRGAALFCAAVATAWTAGGWAKPGYALAGAEASIPGYEEYSRTPGGVLYEDIRIGDGAEVAQGDKVVVDWAAYTVHRGFVVQAKLLTKGGAFEGDDNSLLRFRIADGSVIPAIDEALLSMRAGSIRRLIVQPGPMYYPAADKRGDKQTFQAVGPKPTTFSGRRALDQVLTNPGGIDKSIVMDIELLEVRAGGAARRAPGHVVSRRGVTTDTQWDSLGGRRQSGGLYQGS